MTTTEPQAVRNGAKDRRGFGLLWLASAISSVGDGAYLSAGPLLAAFLTKDPVAVAVVAAASSAPWFLVTPWSGAIVDRLSRKWVMVVADAVRAACLAVFAVVVAFGVASTWLLAFTSFLIITGKVFSDAAGQALVPHVVGREPDQLSRANGRIYAAETVGQSLVGPPLGGLAFSLSPWTPFALDAASFGVSAALVGGVKSDTPPATNGQRLGAAIKEGFAHLFRDRGLVLLAASVSAFNIGYNMAFATLVLFALENLGVTDWGYGLLLAVSAGGAALLGLFAAPVVRRLGSAGSLLIAMVAQAAVWLWVALSSSPWAAAPAFVVLGASSTLVTVAAVTARQQHVPDQLLGRVVTAFRLIGNGIAPLGALLGGILAARGDLRTPLFVASAFLVAFAVLSAAPLYRTKS